MIALRLRANCHRPPDSRKDLKELSHIKRQHLLAIVVDAASPPPEIRCNNSKLFVSANNVTCRWQARHNQIRVWSIERAKTVMAGGCDWVCERSKVAHNPVQSNKPIAFVSDPIRKRWQLYYCNAPPAQPKIKIEFHCVWKSEIANSEWHKSDNIRPIRLCHFWLGSPQAAGQRRRRRRHGRRLRRSACCAYAWNQKRPSFNGFSERTRTHSRAHTRAHFMCTKPVIWFICMRLH